MKTTENQTDKFSWRRMAEIGLLYKSAMGIYLLIAALTSLGCYLLIRLCMALGGNFMPVYTGLSLIVGIVFYLSPLTFARRDDTLMSLLPAKPVEKWGFYIIFSILVSTCVIQGIWYGVDYLYSLITSETPLCKYVMNRYDVKAALFNIDNTVLLFLASMVQSCGMILSVLYAVLRCNRHRVVKGLLAMFGCMFLAGFISGMTGFAVAMTEIATNGALSNYPEQIVDRMIPAFKVIYLVFVVYDILMLWLSYRLIAKGEVKG
ncbi:MAG: hypothetical protein HDR85_00440 [Bacteroides sp.]|nr:hypothetical protein [Bacteroides sp.]